MTNAEAKTPPSLRQIAKQLGVSQPFLSQIRAGKRPMPQHLGTRLSALNAYHLVKTEHISERDLAMPNDIAKVTGSSPVSPTTQGGGASGPGTRTPS